MKLLFEKSTPGRKSRYLPPCDVPQVSLPEGMTRTTKLGLPEISENDLSRHYGSLERRTFGVNDGFYPLGSCTMKYNPKINEKVCSLPGFTQLHPLQSTESVQGLLEALYLAEQSLAEITGMDAICLDPAAGSHGELLGLMLMKKYHEERGDFGRKKIIVPDSAHGTNPATASMCDMEVVTVPSTADGCVDLARLKEVVGPDTVGLMITNPNTLGIFENDILEITKIIHDAGGLTYYDGANLNAIAGIVRPGDMGFDCVHLNLHKTFSTPHGSGGPSSGAVGCKDFLVKYLPKPRIVKEGDIYRFDAEKPHSVGSIITFYGNILVVLRALSYIMTLGKEGFPEVAKHAVLNANYFMRRLSERFEIVNKGICMHEFIITMEKETKEKGVTARDMAKALLDHGQHPPTMYFPLIIKEALMVEPTETEGKETLDEAADLYIQIYDEAMKDPADIQACPKNTVIGRPDEVTAARNLILRYK